MIHKSNGGRSDKHLHKQCPNHKSTDTIHNCTMSYTSNYILCMDKKCMPLSHTGPLKIALKSSLNSKK